MNKKIKYTTEQNSRIKSLSKEIRYPESELRNRITVYIELGFSFNSAIRNIFREISV